MKWRFSSLALIVLLTACGVKETSVHSVDDPVLARVGGSEIAQSQLDLLIQRLSPEARAGIDVATRDNMIKSLVRIRALALAAEAQMSSEQRKRLDAQVQAYRDEILAQRYLEANVSPQPVTSQMVVDYYSTHQAEFTQPGKVKVEYLQVEQQGLEDSQRANAIRTMSDAAAEGDWKRYADRLVQNGYPVQYRIAEMLPDSFPSPLRKHISGLPVGGVSDLIFDKNIYRLRILERQEDTVKPLESVSVEIRKKLAPLQLKKALDESVQQLLENQSVEYFEATQ